MTVWIIRIVCGLVILHWVDLAAGAVLWPLLSKKERSQHKKQGWGVWR